MTTVVACYSEGTPYEAMAARFWASSQRAGLPTIVVGFEDRGGWYANTAQKAEEIRRFRRRLRGPLLYVDVDAEIREDVSPYFDRLAEEYDWGAHFFAGPAKGRDRADVCACLRGGDCSKPHRLLSGTLFLGDTPGARLLLDDWVDLNARRRAAGKRDGGGQKNLWRVFDSLRAQLRTARLPGRYCYVYDKGFAYPPGEPRSIVHHIASRDYRPRGNPNR